MPTGALTEYLDVAQVVLYAFWFFFAGLIFYLRTEDKRKGYPLESDRSGSVLVQGFPTMPAPKTFLLRDGSVAVAPRPELPTEIQAIPTGLFPGAPLMPIGDPLVDGVGPAAYAHRADEPDLTFEGIAKIVPLRVATDFSVALRDPDPRGMIVLGADGAAAGVVQDVWVDRSEIIMRYLEVGLGEPGIDGAGFGRTVLVPSTMTRINRWRGVVNVKSILASQFANVPPTRDPDHVTLLEEDRICAYFGGGHLYAVPTRAEAML